MFWAEIWKNINFYRKIFIFLVVKFSIYLNRRAFVMSKVLVQFKYNFQYSGLSVKTFLFKYTSNVRICPKDWNTVPPCHPCPKSGIIGYSVLSNLVMVMWSAPLLVHPSAGLTHCRLNGLPSTIFWKILFSILGMSGYVIYIVLEKMV